ncbi:MAG: hypothetical protein DMD38_14385 [Gemmatimonadetes bacterium]|nr:MAG: hypothetical protein AUI86_00790 [Gemmatimonadetes bacterium 13_1_40CM_3_66_12]OLD85912.1 MAG: hypothetical protein AUG85_11960 [Gemmatimonadetes bacterium 13_1_20CM_4_66_11]PYP94847.1 MAG: hypothetical protein DMD38_14385 [Gemmatimonadota bacterium]
MYEDRRTPPLPPRRFARRMANHVAVAAGLIALSLLVGMWGYEHYEHLLWRDAFLNTAMLLGGMGPVDPLHSNGGKVFAGIFALYAGMVFLVVAGLLLVPVIHRIAHLFHFEGGPR